MFVYVFLFAKSHSTRFLQNLSWSVKLENILGGDMSMGLHDMSHIMNTNYTKGAQNIEENFLINCLVNSNMCPNKAQENKSNK